MMDVNLSISGSVASLTYEPDDVIVIKVDMDLTAAQASEIQQQGQLSFPGARLLVLGRGCTIDVMHKAPSE